MAKYVRQTLPPSSFPALAIPVLGSVFLGGDTYDFKCQLNAATDVAVYAEDQFTQGHDHQMMAAGVPTGGSECDHPILKASGKEKAEALNALAAQDKSAGMHAAAVPAWLLPLAMQALQLVLARLVKK